MLPTTNDEFNAFCTELAKNLCEETNGEVRLKPTWIGAQIAKSLSVNHGREINIHHLKTWLKSPKLQPEPELLVALTLRDYFIRHQPSGALDALMAAIPPTDGREHKAYKVEDGWLTRAADQALTLTAPGPGIVPADKPNRFDRVYQMQRIAGSLGRVLTAADGNWFPSAVKMLADASKAVLLDWIESERAQGLTVTDLGFNAEEGSTFGTRVVLRKLYQFMGFTELHCYALDQLGAEVLHVAEGAKRGDSPEARATRKFCEHLRILMISY